MPASPAQPGSGARGEPVTVKPAAMVALGAVTVLAMVLRIIDLGAKSVWSDEAFSIYLAKQNWHSFGHVITTAEANMSLYYLLLRGWIDFSDAAQWVRLLSALMSAAAVPVIYCIGKEVFSQRAGILAALLLAINPFTIRYAQEARSYSVFVLLASLSFLAFLHGLRRPSGLWGVCYVLSTTLALYAHFFSALVVLVQLVSLAMVPTDKRRLAMRQAAPVGIVIILGLPLVWFVLFRDRGQLAWAPPVHWRDIYDVFRFMVGSGVKLGIGAVAFFIAAAVWLKKCRQERLTLENWSVLVLMLWLFLPVFFTLLVSVWKPMYAPRFLIFCVPAALLLVAEGISEIRFTWIRFVLVLAMLVGEIGPIRSYYAEAGQEDWKSAVAFLAQSVRAGDTAVLPNAYCELPLNYQLEHSGVAAPELRIVSSSELTGRPAGAPGHFWVITCSATKGPNTQPTLDGYTVKEEKRFTGVQISKLGTPGQP